jgi:hypothetical protein
MKPASTQPIRHRRRKSPDGFTPITVPEYVKQHAAANPGTDAVELSKHLQSALKAKLGGARCACGNPIWAIGSSQVGFSCFTCITGEAMPENDYEVVMDAVCHL